MRFPFVLAVSLPLWMGCNIPSGSNTEQKAEAQLEAQVEQADSLSLLDHSTELEPDTMPSLPKEREPSATELALQAQGLVNVKSLDESIQLEVRYATKDNFMGQNLYGDFDQCYLQPEVGEMLVKAHTYLKERHPDLRFLVFDGTRPRSVQRQMWDKVKGTDQQKYVASPKSGSMHNFGAAIDLSLTHVDTGEVDMGTAFDFFGPQAQPRYEDKYLQEGELTQAHIDNRRTLRAAMLHAGFSGILSEWWHFNAFSREYTRSTFKIVE